MNYPRTLNSAWKIKKKENERVKKFAFPKKSWNWSRKTKSTLFFLSLKILFSFLAEKRKRNKTNRILIPTNFLPPLRKRARLLAKWISNGLHWNCEMTRFHISVIHKAKKDGNEMDRALKSVCQSGSSSKKCLSPYFPGQKRFHICEYYYCFSCSVNIWTS